MSQTLATRLSDWVVPMMAGTDGKVAGAALAVSNSAVNLDLTTVPGLTTGTLPDSIQSNNPIGHYLTLEAEGGDVYVIFGPTQASVSGSNAPAPATTNTVTSGVLTTSVGVCDFIASGTRANYLLPRGNPENGTASPCRWLAYITKTGTATLRIWQSSP